MGEGDLAENWKDSGYFPDDDVVIRDSSSHWHYFLKNSKKTLAEESEEV